MRYQSKQYVRWDDLDAFMHVNNAVYLTYAQEARFAWSGILEMVVARAEVDFIAPIYEGNVFVDVELWVSSIGNSSFTMAYEIKFKGEIVARITTVQVAVDMKTKKSSPLNDEQREFLTKYLETQ